MSLAPVPVAPLTTGTLVAFAASLLATGTLAPGTLGPSMAFVHPAPIHAGRALGVPGWVVLFVAVCGLWLAIGLGVATVDRLLGALEG